jgi:hypothetical protein
MSLGAPKSERGRSQGQGLLFRGDREGVKRSGAQRRSAGWRGSRNLQGAERKQKTAVLQGAARLMFSRQAKQCQRDHGQTRENQATQIAVLTEISDCGSRQVQRSGNVCRLVYVCGAIGRMSALWSRQPQHRTWNYARGEWNPDCQRRSRSRPQKPTGRKPRLRVPPLRSPAGQRPIRNGVKPFTPPRIAFGRPARPLRPMYRPSKAKRIHV